MGIFVVNFMILRFCFWLVSMLSSYGFEMEISSGLDRILLAIDMLYMLERRAYM